MPRRSASASPTPPPYGEHETAIARVHRPNEPLPYDPGTDAVEEDGVDALGEAPEFEPGQTSEVTGDMSADDLVRCCKVQGNNQGGTQPPLTARCTAMRR